MKAPYFSLRGFFGFRGTLNFPNIFFYPLYNHPEGMTKELFDSFLTIYHLSAAFYVVLFGIAVTISFIALNTVFFHFKSIHAFFFYALYLYIVFNSIHYPAMAFYDLVSSSGYNAGLSYLLFFISFCLFEYGSQKKKRIIYIILTCIFFYSCVFSMEYYPFVCGCISFTFILYDAVKKRKLNLLHTIFLIICLIVFFRNFFMIRTLVTPDSDGYVGKYTGGTDSGLTLGVTLKTMIQSLKDNSIRYFRELLTQRRYLPSVSILAGACAFALWKRGIKVPVWSVLPFFLIILGVSAVFSFATPDVFVMPRYAWTLFVLICFFILALLTSIMLFLFQLFDKGLSSDKTGDFQRVKDGFYAAVHIFFAKINDKKFLLSLTAVCMFLFSYCALKNSNSPVAYAWKDILKGEASEYNREMTERYAAIFSAEQGNPVYLVPILHRPKSLFVRDSMEFEKDRQTFRNFFCKDEIYFKVGDLILR